MLRTTEELAAEMYGTSARIPTQQTRTAPVSNAHGRRTQNEIAEAMYGQSGSMKPEHKGVVK